MFSFLVKSAFAVVSREFDSHHPLSICKWKDPNKDYVFVAQLDRATAF